MDLRVRRRISNLPHFRDQWSQEKRVQERIGARARESGSGEGQSRWRSQARKATPSLLLAHREAVQFNCVRMMSPESAKLNCPLLRGGLLVRLRPLLVESRLEAGVDLQGLGEVLLGLLGLL